MKIKYLRCPINNESKHPIESEILFSNAKQRSECDYNFSIDLSNFITGITFGYVVTDFSVTSIIAKSNSFKLQFQFG